LSFELSEKKRQGEKEKRREGRGKKRRGKIRRALVLLSRCAHFTNRETYKEKEQNNESEWG
jgi:hypothetical protein